MVPDWSFVENPRFRPMLSMSHTAQEVAQLVVIFHGAIALQAMPFGACSQVRKKLRSTAQLLAHLAAGPERHGLQGNCPMKYYDQLRNFLRSMAH